MVGGPGDVAGGGLVHGDELDVDGFVAFGEGIGEGGDDDVLWCGVAVGEGHADAAEVGEVLVRCRRAANVGDEDVDCAVGSAGASEDEFDVVTFGDGLSGGDGVEVDDTIVEGFVFDRDGGLVGGAALDEHQFIAIVRAAQSIQ